MVVVREPGGDGVECGWREDDRGQRVDALVRNSPARFGNLFSAAKFVFSESGSTKKKVEKIRPDFTTQKQIRSVRKHSISKDPEIMTSESSFAHIIPWIPDKNCRRPHHFQG